MDVIVKVAVIGVTGAVVTLLVRRTNPEFSTVLALGICAVLLTIALTLYSSVKDALELVTVSTGFSSAYTAPVLKCVGIGITARLGGELCKDSGQAAVASAVEICGAICAMYVCLPMIKTLLRMIGELA
jgi:stage III sporulation protein AD